MVQNETVKSAPRMSMPTIQIYLRTILLFLSWLTWGIGSEIIGPTMAILAHNTHATFNGIGSVLAARSAGGLISTVLCGILQNFVNNYQDLMLTTGFILSAILLSVTPFISSLLLMCIVSFAQGAIVSSINMGGTNLLLKIWGTRVTAAFSVIHLGYSCGAIVANLIVRPFLNNNNSYVNTTESSQFNSTLSRSISIPLDVDIRVPYLIAAGLSFLIGVGHFIFLIQNHNNKREKTEKQQVDYAPVSTISSKKKIHPDGIKVSEYSPATCGHGFFGYGLILSIIFTIYIFFVGGTDQAFAKFYFSYLKFDKFRISTNGASWGIILFWLSFSIGRLVGVIESVFIPVHICLIFSWCGGLVLTVMWIIYVWVLGLTSINLFVLGSLNGFIIGQLFPLSFAWINQKLNVIPILLATLFCGGGFGSLVLQKIGGIVMDRDPNHFPTFIAACVIIAIALFILSNIIIIVHERSIKTRHNSIVNDVPVTTDKLSDEEQQMANYLQSVNETATQ